MPSAKINLAEGEKNRGTTSVCRPLTEHGLTGAGPRVGDTLAFVTLARGTAYCAHQDAPVQPAAPGGISPAAPQPLSPAGASLCADTSGYLFPSLPFSVWCSAAALHHYSPLHRVCQAVERDKKRFDCRDHALRISSMKRALLCSGSTRFHTVSRETGAPSLASTPTSYRRMGSTIGWLRWICPCRWTRS